MKKKRLFGILLSVALMMGMMSVVGMTQTVYADDDLYVLEIVPPADWAEDSSYVTEEDMPGFIASEEDTAKAWTGAPSSGYAYLLYEHTEIGWPTIAFSDGKPGAATTMIYPKNIISSQYDQGSRFYYTAGTKYHLWVGGTRVTSGNADNVLPGGDNDGKVKFTPAKGDDPATLTLNGATIDTGYDPKPEDPSPFTYGIYYTGDEPLEIALEPGSENTVKDVNLGIESQTADLAITGKGKLTATGPTHAIYGGGNIKFEDADVTASVTGDNTAICADEKNIEIISGSVTAFGTGDGEGFRASVVTIKGGNVTASGEAQAIFGTVKNYIAGLGWTNEEGSGDGTPIVIKKEGQDLSAYKKVVFKASEPTPPDQTHPGSIHTVSGSKYIVTSAGTVSLVRAKSMKSFTLPATVRIKGKTFAVTGIKYKAFKGTKERTLIVKTKSLTKASVRNSLKSSKIKIVKVKVGNLKDNKKFATKYKKYFTKTNCGKRVLVIRSLWPLVVRK